jgi:sec-independent protein translocase protein TatB
MLPEVGGLEWLIIAVVALIVVGPKDLPPMLRRLGQFVAKMRNMASEFRASFDEMARQSELDDLRKEVEAMRRGQFADIAAQTEHIDDHARSVMTDIEQSMADVGVQLNPPAYQLNDVATAPPLQISKAPEAKKPRKPRAAKAVAAPEPAPKPPPSKPRAKKTAAAPKPTPIVEGGPRRRSKLVEGGR